MKVAPKVILLFKDADGFGAAISAALKPSPNSNLRLEEVPFQLSLERYGTRDIKASGNILHFLNPQGIYEVSVVLLENCEPPLLVCALNELLASLARDNSSCTPTIVVPFILEASKLKLEKKNDALVYGLRFGPQTYLLESFCSKLQNPPPTLQIYHECLACMLQMLRVLGLPSYVLIGQSETSDEDQEVLYEIGEKLASFSALSFSRENVVYNPIRSSIDAKAAWRELYG